MRKCRKRGCVLSSDGCGMERKRLMLERPAREWDGVILADEPVGEGLEVYLSGVVGDEVDSGCGQCG